MAISTPVLNFFSKYSGIMHGQNHHQHCYWNLTLARFKPGPNQDTPWPIKSPYANLCNQSVALTGTCKKCSYPTNNDTNETLTPNEQLTWQKVF